MHKIGHGGTHFTSWAQQRHTIAVGAAVSSLAFSPSAKRYVFAAGARVHVVVINGSMMTIESELTTPSRVSCVIFVGSDDMIATVGDDGCARVWHYKSATETHSCAAPEGCGGACCVAFGTVNGQLVLAVGYVNGTARLWSIDGQCVATLDGHTGPLLGIDVSRASKLVATGSDDGTARLWAAPAGDCLAILRVPSSAACHAVRFGSARTSGIVAVATANGAAYAFEVPASSPVDAPVEVAPAVAFKGHVGRVNDVAVGENGEVLATASQDKTVKLWKLRTGEFCRALPGGGDVQAVAFSTAGAANLATATAKGTLKIFGIVPRGGDAGMLAGR